MLVKRNRKSGSLFSTWSTNTSKLVLSTNDKRESVDHFEVNKPLVMASVYNNLQREIPAKIGQIALRRQKNTAYNPQSFRASHRFPPNCRPQYGYIAI